MTLTSDDLLEQLALSRDRYNDLIVRLKEFRWNLKTSTVLRLNPNEEAAFEEFKTSMVDDLDNILKGA